jgi:hypothetical protein
VMEVIYMTNGSEFPGFLSLCENKASGFA